MFGVVYIDEQDVGFVGIVGCVGIGEVVVQCQGYID